MVQAALKCTDMHRVKAALQTLELDDTASRAEIKQAYRDLVMVWHPDRFPHNPRLRQKAEAKLKGFNQAYEHLKNWRQPRSRASGESLDRHRPTGSRPYRSTVTPGRGMGARNLEISLTDAEFILQHYHFRSLDPGESFPCRYQGGPFVVVVCQTPPEVMISVPCDSLRMFDRILLSIPCKSTGHFIQQEARRLLSVLAAQQHYTSEST